MGLMCGRLLFAVHVRCECKRSEELIDCSSMLRCVKMLLLFVFDVSIPSDDNESKMLVIVNYVMVYQLQPRRSSDR